MLTFGVLYLFVCGARFDCIHFMFGAFYLEKAVVLVLVGTDFRILLYELTKKNPDIFTPNKYDTQRQTTGARKIDSLPENNHADELVSSRYTFSHPAAFVSKASC